MHKINIHGIPFYGKYNKRHYKTLFNISKYTTKEQWKGITAVYCNDGLKQVDEGYGGHYVVFDEQHCKDNTQLLKSMKETDMHIVNDHHYRSPFIYIHGDKLESEHDFVFTLLHELGHHVNRFDNLDFERDEIEAHKFSLRLLDQIYGRYTLKLKYPFIEESFNELGINFKGGI